jgi:hypothetical protein
MTNAFPLIRKEPKELLKEQLQELSQGKAADFESAKIVTQIQAYKRFIEETE